MEIFTLLYFVHTITTMKTFLFNLGTSTSTYENNCHELIKIVYDFILSSNNNSERISENLINGNTFVYNRMSRS